MRRRDPIVEDAPCPAHRKLLKGAATPVEKTASGLDPPTSMNKVYSCTSQAAAPPLKSPKGQR